MSWRISIFLGLCLAMAGCLEPPPAEPNPDALSSPIDAFSDQWSVPDASVEVDIGDISTPDSLWTDAAGDDVQSDAPLPPDGSQVPDATINPLSNSCGDYYLCRLQDGCGCGATCDSCDPAHSENCENSWFEIYPAGSECMYPECAGQVGCADDCFDGLDSVAQQRVIAFEACRTAMLTTCTELVEGDPSDPGSIQSCLRESCWSEYRACFGDEEESCQSAWNCQKECSNSDEDSLICTILCQVGLSDAAAADWKAFEQCNQFSDVEGLEAPLVAIQCVNSMDACLEDEGLTAPAFFHCIYEKDPLDFKGITDCILALANGEAEPSMKSQQTDRERKPNALVPGSFKSRPRRPLENPPSGFSPSWA